LAYRSPGLSTMNVLIDMIDPEDKNEIDASLQEVLMGSSRGDFEKEFRTVEMGNAIRWIKFKGRA
jgi:hypothetical protein